MNDHAVINGASMAGLLAASVLSDRFTHVTLIERDELPDEAENRRGVPQGRHAHVLLAAGEQVLARLFPGIVDELLAAGAVPINAGDHALWHQAGAPRVRYHSEITALSFSRPLLEMIVCRRVKAIANVTMMTGTAVRGLEVDADGCVRGVRVVRGDLVVDSTGRSAPLLRDLGALGHPAPPESHVKIDLLYATRLVRRRPGDIGGADCVFVMSETGRFGVALPVEGDRWIVTLSGLHGDHPGKDPQSHVDFARSLPVPEIAELLGSAVDASPVMIHRMASSQRRHVEKLTDPPTGYVMLGDAICSFNAVYGQGMTSAALQAEALGRVLERHDASSPRLPKAFYRAAAKVVANPWTIAAGSDFNHPLTTGPKPPGTDVVNKYMAHVLRACHTSPAIAEQMMRVQNLLDAPTSLMRPDRMIRVFLASRRSTAPPIGTTPEPAESHRVAA